ncbi:flavin reductase family protein [Kitasatospora sp. NBC_00240]|uniref:flavin reductase family protein n=1 Tax=Kitasatospora sp. NBC_00240 TaxID=2903567 RepID=UPI00225295B0|nr:flavin reductase family protein [Kitasatospora sp. NBC_00240]MCX5208501.1 flavin reductase family protein [Kitasatospora sp. NBC_00240]
MENQFGTFTALLDHPVYVVTAAAGGDLAGCLAGFAGQCSIDPARFVVWISKANHTYGVAARSDALAVHLIPRDKHELAERFGGRSGDSVDKFEDVVWAPGPAGVPLLAEAEAWFVGRVLDRADWGDHVGFLLAPVSTRAPEATASLALHDVKDIDAGHPA